MIKRLTPAPERHTYVFSREFYEALCLANVHAPARLPVRTRPKAEEKLEKA